MGQMGVESEETRILTDIPGAQLVHSHVFFIPFAVCL